MDICGRMIEEVGTANAKALSWGCAWCMQKTARRPEWLRPEGGKWQKMRSKR